MRRGLARVGQYGLVLWVALTLNFALPRIAPGSPLPYLLGPLQRLEPAEEARLLGAYGLDLPIWEQYARYWTDLAGLDLGRSVRFGRPVTEVLAERVPWTLLLVGTATVLGAVVGIAAGALAARRRGGRGDKGLMVTLLSLDAMPGFWVALVLVSVFSVTLGWFPTFGAVSVTGAGAGWSAVADVVHHLTLPALSITLATTGGIFLLTRASLLSTLGEDYTVMAEAKGASERRVLVRHALRNALLPVYTKLTLAFGTLVSGAVVIETVFAYPGVGRAIFEGVIVRDYPLLQGAFLLVTVGVVAANVVADLTYPLLDPRVRRPAGASR